MCDIALTFGLVTSLRAPLMYMFPVTVQMMHPCAFMSDRL